MQIDQVKTHQLLLPFSGDFSHSKRKGAFAKNIVVGIKANHGEIEGYGEGSPRLYVTGESQESVAKSISSFTKKDTFPWELNDVSQIWDFVDGISNGNQHNSAICALEMSLLDALGKKQNKSIISYFPQDFLTSKIFYGATIPLANKQRIMEIGKLIKKQGINKLRLKMGEDFKKNKESIETVKLVFGDDYNLRIDINGAWNRELALRHVQLIKDYEVKVVEQPMMKNDPDISGFASTIKSNGIILMADESACSLKDVENIIKDGHYKMINVRLSKCGGFRNSLRIVDHLRDNGVSFQIGCQLGESGLLSASGRVLSLLCSDAIYYDGSYDKFLLKENITIESLSFGPGGAAGPLDGPGLGVEINNQSLERLCDNSKSVTINKP